MAQGEDIKLPDINDYKLEDHATWLKNYREKSKTIEQDFQILHQGNEERMIKLKEDVQKINSKS